jgi:Mrp family chromosome partitioning ATPase
MKRFFQRRNNKQQVADMFVVRSDTNIPLTAFPAEIVTNYRRMITGLLYQNQIPRRIAMMSALQDEGVTYTSLALAATMANDLSKRICVIELNWLTPGLLQMLRSATTQPAKKRLLRRAIPATLLIDEEKLPQSLGVGGLLQGQVTLEDALIKTNLPNLMLLPAGDLPVDQRPIAARGEEVKTLIEEIAIQFDHLILDIPALLVSSDAVALASLSDAACLVIRQGVTPIAMVKQALDEVKHLSILGVILNQTRIHTPRWLYNRIPQE